MGISEASLARDVDVGSLCVVGRHGLWMCEVGVGCWCMDCGCVRSAWVAGAWIVDVRGRRGLLVRGVGRVI
eukprot:366540-Chlamydomonas_euryale.AAC.3